VPPGRDAYQFPPAPIPAKDPMLTQLSREKSHRVKALGSGELITLSVVRNYPQEEGHS